MGQLLEDYWDLRSKQCWKIVPSSQKVFTYWRSILFLLTLIAQAVIRTPNDLTWKTQLFRTIWLLIFAVMFGLTIHTVVVFFIDYIGYPVTTTVTMKHYDWVSSLINDNCYRALVDCSVWNEPSWWDDEASQIEGKPTLVWDLQCRYKPFWSMQYAKHGTGSCSKFNERIRSTKLYQRWTRPQGEGVPSKMFLTINLPCS